MEDFYYAVGFRRGTRAGELIHRDALTVNGKTMARIPLKHLAGMRK